MLSSFNVLSPVSFLYGNDLDFSINQTPFTTQQGLNLNFVSMLSSCQDELMLNYSNTFLTDLIDSDAGMTVPIKQSLPLSFPTYLAFNSYPAINIATRYLQIVPSSNAASSVTFVPNLCADLESYFVFTDVDGLKCKINTIDNALTKFLTVDLSSLTCNFNIATAAITALSSNQFEWALDNSGYLKLFFRSSNVLYTINYVSANNALSAIPASITAPSPYINTAYRSKVPQVIRNNFIYYNDPQTFAVNVPKSVKARQNYALHYEYESQSNFNQTVSANVDLFKTKNILSDNYFINDKLPLSHSVVQRRYSSILSRQNSEKYAGDLQFNYAFYTKEYYFKPDLTTKFVLPATLYPYTVLNINDSNLMNSGAFGGLSPVFSDKIIKQNNVSTGSIYNTSVGQYLYSWLYTNTLTSYWVDRYYNPKKTTLSVAYTGTSNQIFSYQTDLSAYLTLQYPQDDYFYYDIRSSQIFEPNGTYFYSRIGTNYIQKVLKTFPVALSSYSDNSFILRPTNAWTISFDLDCNNIDTIKSTLLVGNNFDEGVSLYKNGQTNIFTPGYFVNTDKAVNFYDVDNNFTFNIELSAYVGAPVRIIDTINVGFDHPLKVFYVNLSNNYPGFIDFGIDGKVLNKVEFADLANKFNTGLNNKTYYGLFNIYYGASNGTLTNQYNFDYINNTHGANSTVSNISGSSVLFDTGFLGLNGLTGHGGLVFNKYGVSKLQNVIYFKDFNLGLSPTAEYVALTSTSMVFDLNTLGSNLYIQTKNKVIAIDSLKNVTSTYYLNTSAVSGLSIDFINKNYDTKLLSYSTDISGNILVDMFNLATTTLESSFNTYIQAASTLYADITNNVNYYNRVGTGFNNIKYVNQFDRSGVTARLDLYSGGNYKTKTTQLLQTAVERNQRLAMSVDPQNGMFKLYVDGVLTTFTTITANTFLNNFSLANIFGVGQPFIGNNNSDTLVTAFSSLPSNYSFGNFRAYNRALTDDEIKFDALLEKTIDGVNFDIPQGTRNNTDTVTSFNKLLIPGRKNNNIRVFIKNLNLAESDKASMVAFLSEKLQDVLPINTNNISFDFSINNE